MRTVTSFSTRVHSTPSPWRPWLINWEYITQRVNLLLCLPLVHTPDPTDSYHSQHQCHYYWGTHTSRRLYNNWTVHQTTLESAMSTVFQYGSRTWPSALLFSGVYQYLTTYRKEWPGILSATPPEILNYENIWWQLQCQIYVEGRFSCSTYQLWLLCTLNMGYGMLSCSNT